MLLLATTLAVAAAPVEGVAGSEVEPIESAASEGPAGTLPPKILVLRWSIASGAELDGSQLLDDLLTSEVAQAQPSSEVVGMADVEALLDVEQAKDLIGCDDVTCTAEIGLALDAELLVQGSLGTIGDRTFAVLKAIETRDATVIARVDGSTAEKDVTPLLEKLVHQLFGVESAPVYTTLPGTSFEQWLSRMQDLAYAPLRCGETVECLRIALGRIEDIEFLLGRDDWPPELEQHRDALHARLQSLHAHAARLRTLLYAPQQPQPVVHVSEPARQPVVVVVREPPPSRAETPPTTTPSWSPPKPPRFAVPVRPPWTRTRAAPRLPSVQPQERSQSRRARAAPSEASIFERSEARAASSRRRVTPLTEVAPRTTSRSRIPRSVKPQTRRASSGASPAVQTIKRAASKLSPARTTRAKARSEKANPAKTGPKNTSRRSTSSSRKRTVPR